MQKPKYLRTSLYFRSSFFYKAFCGGGVTTPLSAAVSTSWQRGILNKRKAQSGTWETETCERVGFVLSLLAFADFVGSVCAVGH